MFCINIDLVISKNELKTAKYLINNYSKQLFFPQTIEQVNLIVVTIKNNLLADDKNQRVTSLT